MFSVPSQTKFVKILEQAKTSTASRMFTDLLSNSPKRSPRFSQGFQGTESMFTGADLGKMLTDLLQNERRRRKLLGWSDAMFSRKSFQS